eukprot:scaffold176028_cov51-Attheya_sp.AAC.6
MALTLGPASRKALGEDCKRTEWKKLPGTGRFIAQAPSRLPDRAIADNGSFCTTMTLDAAIAWFLSRVIFIFIVDDSKHQGKKH